jgi:general secretion pathway protein D
MLIAAMIFLVAAAQAADPVPSEPPPAAAPAAAPAKAPAKARDSKVYLSLDFTDVDLPVLIKFMSEQTRKNFIFDERVQGKVTIVSPRRMTEEEAYNVFLSVLQVKGFTTVEYGNSIKIVPAREARQETIPTTAKEKGARPDAEFVTRLVPLQHADAPEVVQLLTPLLSKDGMISAFAGSNTVLLIDTRSNIDRLLGIIRLIDVEAPGDMKIYRLTYASVTELAKTLELLFPSSGAAAAPAAATARGASQRFGASRSAVVKFIPEARTNLLIALAPPDVLREVTDLIAKLDVPVPAGGGKINVYYLENADAEEVAKVLASLSGAAAGQPPAQPRAAGQPAQQARGLIAAELEGGVKVTADKATNSLVIVASPNDYETLVGVIRKLDIRRRQVFVEAAIMEIDLDKALDLGVEWRAAAEVSGGSGAILGGTNFDFSGNVNSLISGLVTGNPMVFSGTGLLAGGIGGSVTLPDGTEVPAIAAVLRAAQTRTNLRILSSPHLLTQNNKEAEIIVGENVPFISSQSRDSTNLSNVINTVERKDVGITLRITPHIHESEFVSLDIFQESSALKDTSLLETTQVGPTTTKRSAKTTVLVKSGDTVIIGGIMQEIKMNSESKVPLLGDIPLLGYLFKYTSKSNKRTNLVIMLTPHIVTEPGVLSEKLQEQQRRILGAFESNPDGTVKLPPDARKDRKP